jgi:hypothetical protein
MRAFHGSILAVVGLALASCASIMGTDDQVNVASEPSGATCRVERMAQPIAIIKETPATVVIPRSHYPVDIYCSKEGAAGQLTVWPGTNPWVYGDLVGGGVPYLVDTLHDADLILPETVLVRFPVSQ